MSGFGGHPMLRSIITLTTDFADDLFVGVMKGVIAGINPEARVIDLTHAVQPGDVRAAAFALMVSFGYFPPGTVHVVVVDPGVGTDRRILCARTQNHLFLAPDNGVLSFALAREEPLTVHSVENRTYFLEPVSHTFHGRDIFAPVAAHLTLGVTPEELGPQVPLADIVRVEFPAPRAVEGGIEGEVLYIDRFGNCITNVSAADLKDAEPASVRIEAASLRLEGLATSYAHADEGAPLALIGSTDFLEIAASGASAAERFGLHVGDDVTVTIQTQPQRMPPSPLEGEGQG